jgi:hypothetical protein
MPVNRTVATLLTAWEHEANTLLAILSKYLLLLSPIYSRVFFTCVQFLALSVTCNLCEQQRWRCASCDVVTHVLAHARLLAKSVLQPQDPTTNFEFIFDPKMLAFRLARHQRWHRWMNALPRQSSKGYRSVLCLFITLAYILYSFW